MKFLSTEKISEHKRKTPEGYLICIDSILARTGKQTYTRNEVFHDDSEEEIEIDRTEDEVFSPQTLASFENKPLTVEHPDEDVNSENWKDYQVGFVRDIKRGKGENGEDVMLGTLVIQDAQTIKEVEAGEHTQLSCGYDCDVTNDSHPRQVRIRGNHVALCQQGRAGIARIVDSVKDEYEYIKGFVFSDWDGDVKGKFDGFYNPKEVETILNNFIIYTKNRGHSDLNNFNLKNNDGFTITFDGGTVYIDFLTTRYQSEKQEIAKMAKKYFGTNSVKFTDSTRDDGPTETHKFEVGFVDQNDHSDYVDIKASSPEEAIKIVKNTYHPYRVFHVRQVDSVKDSKESDVTSWWREVETWNSRNGYKFNIDNDYNDVDGMLDAMWDMLDDLKTAAPDLYQKGKRIYNKYSTWSKKTDSMKDSKLKMAKDLDIGDVVILNDEPMTVIRITEYGSSDNMEFTFRSKSGQTYAIGSGRRDTFTMQDSYSKKVDSMKDVDPCKGESKEDFIQRFMKETASEYPDKSQRLAVAYSYWNKTRDSKPYVLIQKINGKEFKLCDAVAESGEKAIQQFRTKNPQFENRPLKAVLKSAYKDSKPVKTKDGKETFTISWIDNTSKSEGYPREFWKHEDQVKANSAHEALEQLAKHVGLSGIGTYNATINSMRSDSKQYFYYGRLSELLNRVKDSKK